ncbi:MAG: hypothetical protein AXA67_02115 [Methylothermaceae bacteria B42]|nr:MAG: hypothetical protein AXA67_02115 [Methylothermaceae bacteria B42]HHJ40057.1 hypothetical protein [Methylothermaceae bacterium]
MATKKSDLFTHLTLGDLEKLTGRARHTIRRRLERARIKPVKVSRNTHYYHPPEALRAIYADPSEGLHQQHLSVSEERAKLLNAQRRKVEMEMDERAGRLIEIELVCDTILNGVNVLRNRLEQIPLAIASQVITAEDESQVRIIIMDEGKRA